MMGDVMLRQVNWVTLDSPLFLDICGTPEVAIRASYDVLSYLHHSTYRLSAATSCFKPPIGRMGRLPPVQPYLSPATTRKRRKPQFQRSPCRTYSQSLSLRGPLQCPSSLVCSLFSRARDSSIVPKVEMDIPRMGLKYPGPTSTTGKKQKKKPNWKRISSIISSSALGERSGWRPWFVCFCCHYFTVERVSHTTAVIGGGSGTKELGQSIEYTKVYSGNLFFTGVINSSYE